MKKYFLLVLVFTSFLLYTKENNLTREESLDYIFDLNNLPEIQLTITEREWNKLLINFDKNPVNEEYVKGDFTFTKNGKIENLKNIGIRIRGNGFSRKRPEGIKGSKHNKKNPSYHHAHFRINFDKFNKKNRFQYLEALNLKWFNSDPTYVREIYCYDLFRRAGVYTAPRSSYVRLKILIKGDFKPAYFGVYQMIEPVDKDFLKARFGKNDDGDLWKCLYPADLTYGSMYNNVGIEYIDANDNKKSYSPAYDLKTNKKDFETKAKPRFEDFVLNLNSLKDDEFSLWIAEKMDVPLFLKTLAVNVLVGMWDDYWNNKNNYYLYFDEKDKVYFIPYDYDNTLGTSIKVDIGQRSIIEWAGLLDVVKNNRPLVTKILDIPHYKEMYLSYIEEIIDPENKLFDKASSIERIKKWQKMIEKYVDNDTNEDTVIEDKPAPWGNCHFYRLLEPQNDMEKNYFEVRSGSASQEIKEYRQKN